MATTVNSAFYEFMRDTVNLDSGVVSAARASRDNLLDNIAEFSEQNGFFTLCSDYNVHFGSFARKTKCRELDDVDLMIGLSANGATYCSSDPWDNVRIYANTNDSAQKECTNADGTLNSTKVANKFKKKLEGVREYSRSDVRRNGEAVVLNLKSKVWSFDIVPCFRTTTESNGRDYYLIPNGRGTWMKTDPRKDRERISSTNQGKNGRLLELIRLVKKWNKVKNAKTIPSYLLETMMVNYAESVAELDSCIDFRFKNALRYIADNILGFVYDMKEIQGNINLLSFSDRFTLQAKAQADYEKACEAWGHESVNNQKQAIKKWGEIFGRDFPEYG